MNAIATPLNIALVGNPNCGKTALFNLLTGARQKVANYAGVTVERKAGRFATAGGRMIEVLDLPGAYSLVATSPDEAITRAVCTGTLEGERVPDLLVAVVDATNLRLHLRLVLELRALGRPLLVALNMMDAARRRGIEIDRDRLERELGVPVIETVAVRRGGADALRDRLEALHPAPVASAIAVDPHSEVNRILGAAVRMPSRTSGIDEAIDRVVLHPLAGPALLAVVMFLMFQAVFAWAAPLMDGIEAGIGWLGEAISGWLPDGVLRSLLVDGIIAGTGAVLVFLPQILILFLFILALEESGYLPRAAVLLDRLMVGAGLSGRSFIPLLSSFACAIPGIMATRTIPDPRDRLATIMVAPLMTCSARLPVYAILIGAFVPERSVGGIFNLQGVVLFVLYLAGIVSALAVAWVMKRRRPQGDASALLLELPSYRVPDLRSLAIGLWERGMIFLKRVGGVILTLMILLWALSSWPNPPPDATGPAIQYSLAGMLGAAIQPLFAPLGFNWQICIALIPGMAAREVAVGALGTVYALSGNDDAVGSQLIPILSAQWSMATAFALLAWYVFAPQCLSTLAVIRRETNSWRITGFATAYLFALAWIAAFITYQVTAALAS